MYRDSMGYFIFYSSTVGFSCLVCFVVCCFRVIFTCVFFPLKVYCVKGGDFLPHVVLYFVVILDLDCIEFSATTSNAFSISLTESQIAHFLFFN